jgi:hypothetical protein
MMERGTRPRRSKTGRPQAGHGPGAAALLGAATLLGVLALVGLALLPFACDAVAERGHACGPGLERAHAARVGAAGARGPDGR